MKIKKIINVIFVILITSPCLLFYGSFFRKAKLKSNVENRMLVQFPKFKIKEFLKGEFQNNLEDSISDQMILSGTLRVKFNENKNKIHQMGYEIVKKVDKNFCNQYIAVSKSYYNYNCDDYEIDHPQHINVTEEDIKRNALNYNKKLKGSNIYLYFVNSSRNIDFTKMNERYDTYNFIIKNYNVFKFDQLKIDSYDDFKKYFYKTDHHWNYNGQYQGYKDIINLLLGPNEKKLVPYETKTFDAYFWGSRTKNETLNFSVLEKFTANLFNIPKHIIYINGEKEERNKRKLYEENDYSVSKLICHYALYYGTNKAELIYDFNNKDKENLLIIATSYANPVNELIASHFNKTFVINIEHYQLKEKNIFQPDVYIENNKINKVLIIGDIYTFGLKKFMIGEID